MAKEGLQVSYGSSESNLTLLNEDEWYFQIQEDKSIKIYLTNPVEATYIKVHAVYHDVDEDLLAQDLHEFANIPGDMVTVYAEDTVDHLDEITYAGTGRRATEERTLDSVSEGENESTYYDYSHLLMTNGSGDAGNGCYGFLYDDNGNLTAKAEVYTLNATTGIPELDTSQGIPGRISGTSPTG